MFDGAASPVTQTFGLGLFAEPTSADLDRLEAFFKERRAPVCHEVSPLAGVPLADLLSRRGYRPIEVTSVMYKPLIPAASSEKPLNPRLRTRPMAAGEDELWAQINARGWGDHPEWTDFLLGHGRVMALVEGLLGRCPACQDAAGKVNHNGDERAVAQARKRACFDGREQGACLFTVNGDPEAPKSSADRQDWGRN